MHVPDYLAVLFRGEIVIGSSLLAASFPACLLLSWIILLLVPTARRSLLLQTNVAQDMYGGKSPFSNSRGSLYFARNSEDMN